MPIRILDAETVGRIAAGEVVERPSSVAKELIENALDAGATAITVDMREGGIAYLRVTDNGCGIAPEEIRMAFQNHATSKLSSPQDLDDIRTMGFRGEALPSIASVAKVTCTTRPKDKQSGMTIRIEGGQILSLREAGCPSGTTIILEDLFYNTPVRRTFLKKPSYEASVLSEMVFRLMLANPCVGIRLISNGKTICQTFTGGTIRDAAMAIYGKDIASRMLEMDESLGGLRIRGLIGVGDCGRQNRSQQSFFINGRVVRCLLLSRTLENACKTRVTIGMYPMCALHLSIPPQLVDVNVHPGKLEVRFRDEMSIQTTLEALFARVFAEERVLNLDNPEMRTQGKEQTLQILEENVQDRAYVDPMQVPDEPHKMSVEPAIEQYVESERLPDFHRAPVQMQEESIRTYKSEILRSPVASAEQIGFLRQGDPEESQNYRLVGVVFDTYLILQTKDAMILIDQHAAHERILYEQYEKLLYENRGSQRLLVPLVFGVTQKEMQQLSENQDLLLEAGYEIEPFGDRDIRVLSVPYILGQADPRPLFLEMISRLGDLRYATQEKRRQEVMQLSCKHAVKGGDRLRDEEIQALLDEMQKTKAPPTCPHGRPVAREWKVSELEKLFKRKQ